MDFEKIKELIKLVNNSKIVSFELTSGNETIRMDKSPNRNSNNGDCNNSSNELEEMDNQDQLINTFDDESAVGKEDLKYITAPMVGTFYASASPTSETFVKKGDKIKNGTVLCIIEAMKLMNEIESEYTGTIIECLVNDGDMVEYGQPLFRYKED